MIIVLFPPGAFGSTVEYCLRQFSQDLTKKPTHVMDDGSMHGFDKEFHPRLIDDFVFNKHAQYEIATPLYPGLDYMSIEQTFQDFMKHVEPNQKVILIHLPTHVMAERNQLFCYHKIPILLDNIMKNKHLEWNHNYRSWQDMQNFELREALSFYIDLQTQHLSISQLAPEDWLCVTPDDILYNFQNTVLNMLEYCNLARDLSQDIEDFYVHWFSKQQYILDEFVAIEQIFENLQMKKDHSWSKLSIMGEAIVQSRLRGMGIELACHGLNKFPDNLQDLQKLFLNKGTK